MNSTFTTDTTMDTNDTRLDHTNVTGFNTRPASLSMDWNTNLPSTGLDLTPNVETNATGLNNTQDTNGTGGSLLNSNGTDCSLVLIMDTSTNNGHDDAIKLDDLSTGNT